MSYDILVTQILYDITLYYFITHYAILSDYYLALTYLNVSPDQFLFHQSF